MISGVGCVAPNGVGSRAYADALLAGVPGVRAIRGVETSGLKTTAAAQVVDFDPRSAMDTVDLRRVPRLVPMAVAACREAMAEAGLSIDPDDLAAQRRVGVCLGTGGGGQVFVEEQYRAYYAAMFDADRERDKAKLSPFAITAGTHGNLSSELSIELKLRGPSHVVSTGCASSTDAIGHAAMMLRAGHADAMLAGGADSPVSAGILTGFERMGVIGTRRWEDPSRASRPFTRDRDGFILGEGAWMFVLETLENARRRGAVPVAELLGYGSTCDAFHRVRIAPDAAESVRAMELALGEAGVGPGEVGYVNLHGTGTELNDRLETLAVRRVLGAGADGVPTSATKSMIGHPQGACGAAGLAATILCLRRGMVHPTINLDAPDPECDLDYVPNEARRCDATVALCNCIAFGSKNSALVVRVRPLAASQGDA